MRRIYSAAFALVCGVAFAGVAAPAHAYSYKLLYSFRGGRSDGATPVASLINVGGTLYGTAFSGGAYLHGTVFSVNPTTGAETTVYAFKGGSDGANPAASLINVNGTLYGTTFGGGTPYYFWGAVFSVSPTTGAETTVYAFKGGSDGAGPQASLIQIGHKLFGTTRSGGAHGAGAVFALNLTTNAENIVYSFKGGTDGSLPMASLINVGGTLYGTTTSGGAHGYGTVFALVP
jgi:uncharacterized repeat protein (TIGR03803 family)